MQICVELTVHKLEDFIVALIAQLRPLVINFDVVVRADFLRLLDAVFDVDVDLLKVGVDDAAEHIDRLLTALHAQVSSLDRECVVDADHPLREEVGWILRIAGLITAVLCLLHFNYRLCQLDVLLTVAHACVTPRLHAEVFDDVLLEVGRSGLDPSCCLLQLGLRGFIFVHVFVA